MKKSVITLGLAATMGCCTLTSCDSETLAAVLEIVDLVLSDDGTTIVTDDGHGLGWLSNDENTEEIEDDIQINSGIGSEVSTVTGLPTKVDLSAYLPSVGDQGQFGTCTAWATAYNARTWMTAYERGVRGKSLDASSVSSAADLFQAIDSNKKGAKCMGSSMEDALDILVNRGVSSVASARAIRDYTDCDCNPSASANNSAREFKIKNYREVNVKDPATIKRYLSEGKVVLFGAKLGDNFMACRNGSVISSHGTFNYTGIHAYHAILCVGYDDNKGANGAFRVINSWGNSWGEDGYCWVDQKFFCGGDFAYCGFVMYGNNEVKNPNLDNEGYVDETIDLIASKCTDEDYYEEGDEDSNDPRWRTLLYDVVNAGEGVVSASKTWGICYMLYNAYNANDYEIVLFDLYTDKIGGVAKNQVNDNWSAQDAKNVLGVDAQGFAISNIDIPGKTSVCDAVMKATDPDNYEEGSVFSWSYKLPDVTGKYYLVLMSDAFGAITESNEDNNFYFLATADNKPLDIKKGVIQTPIGTNKSLMVSAVKPKKNAVMPNQTNVKPGNLNTYTPEELATMIRVQKESGEIGNKALRWRDENEVLVKNRRSVKY